MIDLNGGYAEYKVLVWDSDETSTATYFRGPNGLDHASDHFTAMRAHPDSQEVWFFQRVGDGWHLVAPPMIQA